jgi:guanylate kinase
MHRPLLIIVSAPSGAGKSTLCDRLLAESPDIVYSVSCTTRPPRGEEQDGVAYNFLSTDLFEQRVRDGAFLEHAVVHDNRYGTLKETVREAMAAGKSVMMDIDVQGAQQVRETLAGLPGDDAMVQGFVDVFIQPPSIEVLRQRLEGRGEDAPEVIERRLKNAEREMACAAAYRHCVINDDLDTALAELRGILDREGSR